MDSKSSVSLSKSSKTRRITVSRSLYKFIADDAESLLELRKRLRKMGYARLYRFIEGIKYMCSPGGQVGQSQRELFVIQLSEAQAELTRRDGIVNPGKNDARI
jgi:hypothetical protein